MLPAMPPAMTARKHAANTPNAISSPISGFFSRFSPSKPQSPISKYNYTIEGSICDLDNDIAPRPYLQTMGLVIQSADSHELSAARYPVAASMAIKYMRSRTQTMARCELGDSTVVSHRVRERGPTHSSDLRRRSHIASNPTPMGSQKAMKRKSSVATTTILVGTPRLV